MRTLAILAAVILFCSCTEGPTSSGPDAPARTIAQLTAAEQEVLQTANEFGFQLFRRVAAGTHPDSNVFLSPLSASYALGMLENGAAGATRDSIMSTLCHTGMTTDEINESYRDVCRILMQADPQVDFSLANSIWYRYTKPVSQDFFAVCTDYFDARVQAMDWAVPGAVDTINTWVSDATSGRITEAVASVDLNPAMLLINAIYFLGLWTIPFDEDDTHDGTFTTAGGNSVACRMMRKSADEDTTLRLISTPLFTGATMPYGTGAYRMTVLVPTDSTTVDEVIDSLTPANWAGWLASSYHTTFDLALPRFTFEFEASLDSALKDMGMSIAYGEGTADFTTMFDGANGWVDKVYQKSFVRVDEAGTEAAAVTVVVVVDSMPTQVIVNKPSVFVIHERTSGAVLFTGRLSVPVWSE